MTKVALIIILVLALITAGFIQIAYMDYNTYNYYSGLSTPLIDFGYTAKQSLGFLTGFGENFSDFLEEMGITPTQLTLKVMKYHVNQVGQYAYLLVYLPYDCTMENFQSYGLFKSYRIYAYKDIVGFGNENNVSRLDKIINNDLNDFNTGGRKYVCLWQQGDNVGYPSLLVTSPNKSNSDMYISMDTDPIWLAQYSSYMNYTYYGTPYDDTDDLQIAYNLVDIYDAGTNVDISKYTMVKPY